MPVKNYADDPASVPPAEDAPDTSNLPGTAPTAAMPALPHARLIARVEATRFDPANPPPVEPWVFKLAGVEVAHSGNLITIAAALKSGKSSVIAAMIASMMGEAERDYLGFTGSNPDAKAVLHFDTEQSRGDHYQMMMRALRRADITTPPGWFFSYSLLTLSPLERRTAINEMARHAAKTTGLHSIFIDGVADLVLDVNDLAEAGSLVAELHLLATETACVIANALHHNPGGEKTRGHLGSQIERKSESVLVLRKDDAVISVSCKPARRAEISDANAPRFTWDVHAGMHLLAQSKAASADERKRLELGELADEVFGDNQTLRWTAIQEGIKSARGGAKSTIEGKIKDMKRLDVIRSAGGGLYAKGQP